MNDNEAVHSVEDAESEPSVDCASKKHRIVLLLLAYSATLGIIKTLSPAIVLVGAMCACLFVTAYATLYVGAVAGLCEVAKNQKVSATFIWILAFLAGES